MAKLHVTRLEAAGCGVILVLLAVPVVVDMFSATRWYGENEPEAAAEYARIIPGDVFHPEKLAYCTILAEGTIGPARVADYLGVGWTRAALAGMSGLPLEDDNLTAEKNALILWQLMQKHTEYTQFVNLSDGFVAPQDLVGARVIILRITSKREVFVSLMGSPGAGVCCAFIVVSARGFVLVKHDIHEVRYLGYSRKIVDDVASDLVFLGLLTIPAAS